MSDGREVHMVFDTDAERVLGGRELPECTCDEYDSACPVYAWLDEELVVEVLVMFFRWGAGLPPRDRRLP